LLEGLQRIFWLDPDPQDLWEALDMTARNGTLDLVEFTRVFGTVEQDLSNAQKWSVAHHHEATPDQDTTAAYRNLRAAQQRNPTRQRDTSRSDLDAMSCNETISIILKTLESTEIRARKLFQELDAGQDRGLDVNELHGALNVLGLPVTKQHTASVIHVFDKDLDRKLKYSEFIRLMAFVQNQRDVEQNGEEARMRRNGGARSSSTTSSYAIDTNYQESEVSYKPTTVRDAARCSKARKQREEVAQAIGVDSIDPLDYKRLEMISNGIYSSKRKVRTLFKLMDQDGSKNVDAEELCHGLQECQVQVTQEECTALVNHFSQGNGALKYSQFIRMLAASR